MSTVVISHDLHKNYGKKEVLSGLDLELGPGIHGLLGRNGVGKSTLLSIIAGQVKPSSGDVRVLGARPFDNADVMDRVALTGVDVGYPATWRARDVLKAAALRYPQWEEETARKLVAEFALDDALGTAVGTLSRGQRAMLGNIVGMASGAQLTLLDEPYVGLDTHNTDVLYRNVLTLPESGRTVVMATHHIADAAKLLDSALVLGRDGRLTAHLTPDEADAYVVAAGSFEEPLRALAYRRLATGAKAILTAEDAAAIPGVRTTPVLYGELIEAFLEVS